MSVKEKPSTVCHALSSNSSETTGRRLSTRRPRPCHTATSTLSYGDFVGATEGASIGHRCDAYSLREVLTKVGGGAEAGHRRDPLHRLVGRLQQVLRAPHPLHQQ